MSNSQFIGQLKQNNIQINNLKDQFFRTEAHMSNHEKRLNDKVDEFMEKQNFDLKMHILNTENPHHVTKEQVGLSNVINEEQATKVAFSGHLDDKKNPHAVTKSQVGLSKVDNIQQASKVDFDAHDADLDRHITKDERSYWNSSDERTKSLLAEHTDDQSNPHKVTAEQVGLGNVDNVKQATKSDFDNHLNDTNVHVTAEDQGYWNDMTQQFKDHNENQERHVSVAERKTWNGAITYANIMLKNGATVGTRTPIYAKWGALLVLRGHVRTEPEIVFGSIPAELVPFGGAVKSVPLSGTGGTANLIIYDNGDLKIKYPDPADSNKMGGGYYLDVVVGFQKGDTT
ncbi:hypothetical protein B7941_17290 [Bacillus velezensis]|uniref:hypothetical protein n=1 Tax=Bacillus velezensis TaxID=492670 RepID=UPI000A17A9A0|nr:hypothetical protein [Bacillus velezensis]ARJ76176.1 hypothetical protein B7941_17290 [Bacillus velezensis]